VDSKTLLMPPSPRSPRKWSMSKPMTSLPVAPSPQKYRYSVRRSQQKMSAVRCSKTHKSSSKFHSNIGPRRFHNWKTGLPSTSAFKAPTSGVPKTASPCRLLFSAPSPASQKSKTFSKCSSRRILSSTGAPHASSGLPTVPAKKAQGKCKETRMKGTFHPKASVMLS